MGPKRLLRAIAIALALAGAHAVVAPEAAEATTIAELTDAQLTDAATYIVRGTVVEVWPELDDGGVLWTRARVQVTRTYKGPDGPDEVVVDSLGGRFDDRDYNSPSAARFSEGEDVLLFLADIAHGQRLSPVGGYLGKFLVRRPPGERSLIAQRWVHRTEDTYDGRFLPFPAPERRLYLDDLEARVEARLAVGWDGKPIPGISREKLEKINTPARRISP